MRCCVCLLGHIPAAECRQVIVAKDIFNAKEAGTELGLSDEEMALYDALTKSEAIMDFTITISSSH